MECHGIAEYVIVNGRVCVDEEQLRVVEGHGRFIETPVFPPFMYDIDNAEKLKPAKNGIDEGSPVGASHQIKTDYHEPEFCCTPTLPESVVTTPSCKGARPEGQRNIQDSTFSISGWFTKKINKLFLPSLLCRGDGCRKKILHTRQESTRW